MKILFTTLSLTISLSSIARVDCKLFHSNSEGEVFSSEMVYTDRILKHEFTKSGPINYLVEVYKNSNDVRVEVKKGFQIVLSSWASFDRTGVMQIEFRESKNLSSMIYCEK